MLTLKSANPGNMGVMGCLVLSCVGDLCSLSALVS